MPREILKAEYKKLTVYIQVAKQVRTVPVRGFGAEERFDAEECDLEDYAPPPPQSHA